MYSDEHTLYTSYRVQQHCMNKLIFIYLLPKSTCLCFWLIYNTASINLLSFSQYCFLSHLTPQYPQLTCTTTTTTTTSTTTTPFKLAILYGKIADALLSFLLEEAILLNTAWLIKATPGSSGLKLVWEQYRNQMSIVCISGHVLNNQDLDQRSMSPSDFNT